jgi:hypothetical protein
LAPSAISPHQEVTTIRLRRKGDIAESCRKIHNLGKPIFPGLPSLRPQSGGRKDCHAGFGLATAARTVPGLAGGEEAGDI